MKAKQKVKQISGELRQGIKKKFKVRIFQVWWQLRVTLGIAHPSMVLWPYSEMITHLDMYIRGS